MKELRWGRVGCLPVLAWMLWGAVTAERARGQEPVSRSVPPAASVPVDARVLFDGTSLAAWMAEAPSDSASVRPTGGWTWDEEGLRAGPSSGALVSREPITNGVLRLEFRLPVSSDSSPRAAPEVGTLSISDGIDILLTDSSGQHVLDANRTCGALGGIQAPDENPCRPAGQWQTLELAVRREGTSGTLLSAWLNGVRIHHQVLIPTPGKEGREENSGGEEERDVRPRIPPRAVLDASASRALAMDESFTVSVEFSTEHDGPLFAKAPPTGRWLPDGKTLFVRNGRLVYDVGWVGEVVSEGPSIADGVRHHGVLTHAKGRVRLFLDGELAAEGEEFARPDPEGFVVKVGSCATDFPPTETTGFAGRIRRLAFLNRALSVEEAKTLSAGSGDVPGGTVLYRDEGREDKFATRVAAALGKSAGGSSDPAENELVAGNRIRLRAGASGLRFANIWVQPLADVDHAAVLRAWDADALERGRKTYETICIVCHGNLEQEGSLPTSRKFWDAPFKNGGDPYALYRTLSEGYGQMPPFVFLTPEQRYDVIHFIREALVKPTNAEEYTDVTDDYLASLPRGLGGATVLTDQMKAYAEGPQYLRMDFGPVLNWTLEVEPGNIAYKGIAARVDPGPGGISRGRAWVLYDHDTLRMAAAWTGDEFVDWRGIAFDGSHGTHTAIVGERQVVNPVGPGWAHPQTGSWDDPRFRGRDDKPYGPLPREWARYRGQYRYGDRLILSYVVGDTEVLESPGLEPGDDAMVFTRTLNLGPVSRPLLLRVAPVETGIALAGPPTAGVSLESMAGFHVVRFGPSDTPVQVKVLMARDPVVAADRAVRSPSAEHLTPYLRGGPRRWTETASTGGEVAEDDAAYVVDILRAPHGDDNPYRSWLRFGGFDFLPDGDRAAICTWNGDVWIVDGIQGDLSRLTWTRIAAGLFQPLGVKVLDGVIYVGCRDQIVALHDLNGDEEIDWYRCVNSDHQVTEHFHEFAMGLQTDAEGNFYYTKSARHALPALVEQHGTLIKVAADGSSTDILATGFRAANGVCLNDDGSFFVTDQEGHWTPKNRINRVIPGGFYGNMMGYHDCTSDADEDMDPAMVWITNEMDRSPGELAWVRTGGRWGPLEGALLNFSYGTGRIFVVPHERVDDHWQGGVVALPVPDFPTGVMRGRFHPETGDLFTCGLFAWAGNRQHEGGFYRVRYTGRPLTLATGLEAKDNGLLISFSGPLDPTVAVNPTQYRIQTWSLKRTANYGSQHYSTKTIPVHRVILLPDRRSVFLEIPDLGPTWCMEIEYDLLASDGQPLQQRIHNTVHALGERFSPP